MDESLTSDADGSESETESRALVGEKRRNDGGSCCCCCCCCKVFLLLLLCAGAVGFLFRRSLAVYFAGIGVAAARIQFDSIDVGTIKSTRALSPRILASVARPSPVPAAVRITDLVLKAPSSGSAWARVGGVSVPPLRVEAFEDLRLNFTAHVRIEDLLVFGLAGKRAVQEPESIWLVEGKLQVSCQLWLFAMDIPDIPFTRTVTLKGMAGFAQKDDPVTMEAITSAYGYPDRLDTTVVINLFNPSRLAARVDSPTQFNITQRGQDFGTAFVQEVSLKPGANTVSVRFVLRDDRSNGEAIRAFILGYIRADLQTVTMRGSARSSSDALLAVVLSGLNLSFRFKPPPASFIHHIITDVGLIGLEVTAQISNPLPQRIVMGATDLSVHEKTVAGEKIFRLKGNRTSGLGGQVLAPSRISDLKLHLSTLDADLQDPLLIARLIEDAVDGAVVVGVSGPLSITIAPHFSLTLDYVANNVTASLTCLVVCGSAHSMLNPVNWFPSEG